MNNVTLIGRLTKDPELRYTQSGMAICAFTLAVNRESKKDEADFIRVKAFDKIAESIGRYKKRGDQIAVKGHIQTGSYENKDGQKVFTTDVIVERCEFLGSNNQGNQSNQEPVQDNTEPSEQVTIDGFAAAEEDIPF